MMLAIGLVFMFLGLLCGGAMVISPLGFTRAMNGFGMYFLFPGLYLIGYLFLALNVRNAMVAKLSRMTGMALLCLATLAAVVLVIFATGMRGAEGSTLPLWFVLILGTGLGAAGMSLKDNAASKDAS